MNPLVSVLGLGGAKQYGSKELEDVLRILHQASDAFAGTTDAETLLTYAVQSAAEGAHASRAIALLYRRESNAFIGRAPAAGFTDNGAVRFRINIGECAELDDAFFRGTNYFWPSGDRRTSAPAILLRIRALNVLIACLRSGDENIGALCLFDKARKFGGFGVNDLAFVETLTAHLQTALAATTTSTNRAAPSGSPSAKRRFDDLAALEIERAEKLGHSLGCIVIEAAGFDGIVATYGRQTAEFAVTELADCVRSNARHIDVIARDDARTLIVLLPGTDAEAVNAFWNRLAAQIADKKFQSVGTLKVRHGLACYPGGADSPTDVVLAALKELRTTSAA